jgi:ATP-dependent Clp protease ATP-binding subunit ClpA
MAEARDLNHSYVGTEHLLLGLLAEGKGIAAQVLVHSGITLDAARECVLAALGQPPQARPRVARAASIAAMKVWSDRSGALTPATTSASAHMAASIIELLAQDSDVGAVFAAQGIDVAKLAEALRVLAKSSEPSDRADAESPTTPPEPPADAPPSPPSA